ncbi:hypothetical protein AcW1_005712 [Taiwanofungus camphoratus]|nr:hypothetical protein AcW2_004475 [Antrodia cinnamomea]KAI0950631.1 hypothetical protein AcV7_009032 [Antrodia cinnamomea]KAI0957261.1 hypothetical protein AcW1_005712 [Antrodia cinnamomea]
MGLQAVYTLIIYSTLAMAPVQEERKKKKPPTFRHLPVDRAKKLKRSWVETQKIKSQWKAQKRKEGSVVREKQSVLAVSEEDNQPEKFHEGSSDEETEQEDITPSGSRSTEPSDGEDDGEAMEDSDDLPSPRKRPSLSKRAEEKQREESPDQGPTLRQLSRQAYARSSLHHFKSDPLHRHRAPDPRKRESAGDRRRGRSQGESARGRGRGQPDMRLHMNAMLEKIKRDLA